MVIVISFFILSIFIFISSMYFVFHSKTLHSSLGLALTMVLIGMIYALLHFPLLTFIQIILYTGALMVMIVYLIMSQGYEEEGKEISPFQMFFGYILSLTFLFTFSKIMYKSFLPKWEKASSTFGSIKEIGVKIVESYGLPFEILSLILIVAMVGVVVLAKRSF